MKFNKLILIFFLFFGFCNFSFANEFASENPQVYSDEYFDYLIECTSIKPVVKNEDKKEEITPDFENEDVIGIYNEDEGIIEGDFEPFKLRIEESSVGKYSQRYIKEDTKTIIPITEKFAFTQDFLKFKNKYSTDDLRTLTGFEYKFNKIFKISSGLETNYRGLDQMPISKKVYFTPSLNLNDKLSIDFHNKYYTQSKETDHDIGLKISPFKSKSTDLGVYTGVTRNANGSISESVKFTTTFSFF